MSNPKLIHGTLPNERIPFSRREKALADLRAWGESLSERQRQRLREEHPELDEETIRMLVNWAWHNVRGSMDE